MTNDDDGGNGDGLEQRVIETMIDLREERGWSQSELARRMVDAGWPRYTQMTVSRTEKGERPIRLNEAEALAEVFGISLYELWLPRTLRRYSVATAAAIAQAEKLKVAAQEYIESLHQLAIAADATDLAEDEQSYVTAIFKETPEAIVARARHERLLTLQKNRETAQRHARLVFQASDEENAFFAQDPENRSFIEYFKVMYGGHRVEAAGEDGVGYAID